MVPKYRGNSRFISGLQPGRHPHAMPTELSTDMIMKVSAPCPSTVRQRADWIKTALYSQKASYDCRYTCV